MFGDLLPPEDSVCRDFSISVTLKEGDQDDVNDLIKIVTVAIKTGIFATGLGFCMVLIEDQVDESCTVTNASTNVPTNAPTAAPTTVPTTIKPTQVPTGKSSKKKKSTKSKKTKSSKY